MQVKSETPARYEAGKRPDNDPREDEIILQALDILRKRLYRSGDIFSSPQAVKDFLQLRIGMLEHEEFHLLLLTNRHALIAHVPLFRGTLTQASVYPREVVKEAIKYNAAAVIFAHNHPGGADKPSPADHTLTQTLKTALALVDVRVLDHFVVTAQGCYSFAEHGEI